MSVFTALDFRHALRKLGRSPGFTAATVLTLALGIGATTAIFSVIDGVILRPLPYVQPERLVGLWHSASGIGVDRLEQSDGTYLMYRRLNRVFDDMGAYQSRATSFTDLTHGSEPERVDAAGITASLLSTLRVHPLRGAAITEDEDRPHGASVVLIGEQLWRRKFGGDPAVIGRTVQVDGVARQVIGIMPAAFQIPTAGTQLWYPLGLDPNHVDETDFNYDAIARLKPGVSLATARSDIERMIPLIPENYHGLMTPQALAQAKFQSVVHPLRDDVVGDVARILWILLGTVGVVLLIACANVANLFVVRAEARQKEVAVRTALGAGQWEVMRQFLSESVLLAAAGGTLGVGLAFVGVRLLRASPTLNVPRLSEVSIDLRTLAFAVLVTAMAAVLFSLLPMLRYRTPALAGVLKDGGRGTTTGKERHRARSALVVAQVAMALVLLAGSGLMLRSFSKLRSVRPGFDGEQVLTMRVAVPRGSYPRELDAVRFYSQALDRVRQVPGVVSAGLIGRLPLRSEGRSNGGTWIEDFPTPAGSVPPVLDNTSVSEGYFATMGVRLLAGRDLDRADRERVSDGVVVSQALAERFWKGQSPLGKRLHIGPKPQWYSIVGVVSDVRMASLEKASGPLIYTPIVGVDSFRVDRALSFVVRTSGEPTAATAAVRAAIHSVDASLAIFNVLPMRQVVADAMARTSFTLLLLGIASAIALILGAVGIYGVISYVVSLRTREIGVRLALGARVGEVRRMVTRQGVELALGGVLVGLAMSVIATRWLSALLFEVNPSDPLTLIGVSLALLAVAALASWIPARRASRIDPVVALRSD